MQNENAYYFATIFAFIFLPLLLVFLWLNTVIAREIWKRKKPLNAYKTDYTEKKSDVTSSSDTGTIEMSIGKNGEKISAQQKSRDLQKESESQQNRRKQRQLRMFKVILIIMITFFICRIPMWSYLIFKMYNDASENIHWVLHYAFGSLSLLNTLLNPFLYTFLGETIKMSANVETFFGKLCRWKFCGNKRTNSRSKLCENSGVYLGD